MVQSITLTAGILVEIHFSKALSNNTVQYPLTGISHIPLKSFLLLEVNKKS